MQIIATYRSDDLHRTHPLRRLLERWERVPGVAALLGGREHPAVPAEAALAALRAGHPRTAWELCDEALAELPDEPVDDADRALRAMALRCRDHARDGRDPGPV
ncbi:hypothetical protein [Nocardiopsis sp. CC223A]|uniref:hypothetical protein n=1 Tax=Nocardiopsis sp. CC223A TaxID=3044051 RepID=UPI00278BB309|nr:hypothetical protein [Nocardiopsis sp. CC223A]